MEHLYTRLFLAHRVEIFEAYLVLFAIGLSFLFPRLGSAWFRKWERTFSDFARHRTRAVVTVGLLALAARAAVLPLLPVPVPSIHDEFEYLLMADTFSHFRVTNPPHPMRLHLETFHVLQVPSYTGIVPPGQGLLFAAGKLLGGHPFVGVWLSIGVMCAAICWMLQGWLPPPWAFVGGFLAVIRFAVFSYWSDSYWGGALAAAAGAAVLGALPRIWKRPSGRNSVIMALGIAILANTRPYEGLLLCLPVAASLSVWMLRKNRQSWQVSIPRVVLPLVLLLTATGGAMAYYNWRVTGNPLRTAYEINMATVNPVPYFIWEHARPAPAYDYKVFEEFYLEKIMPEYQKSQTPAGFASETRTKFEKFAAFFFGMALGVPLMLAVLMGGFRTVFSGRLRFLSLCLLMGLTGLIVEVQYFPHYAAPFTAIFVALVVQAIRYVRIWRRKDRPIGLLAMRVIPLICLFSLLNGAAQLGRGYYVITNWPHSWYSVHIGNVRRAELVTKLEEVPGKHLVVVRYAPSHNVHDEWVYNDSDIDRSKIVWARDIDPARNQELVDYFHDRHIWLLEPDRTGAKLLPYPNSEPVSTSSAKNGLAGLE